MPGGGGKNHCILGATDFDDPQEVANAIRMMWDMRHLKDALERRTARNIAFADGLQMYEWHPRKRQMVMPRKFEQVNDFLIYNVIKPLMYQKISKISRVDPIWTVPAFTSDEFDQMVARFSNDLMAHYYTRKLNMPEKLENLLRLVFSSPVCWLEPTWDATLGDPVNVTLDDFFRDIPQEADEAMADAMRQEDLDAFRNLHGFRDMDKPVIQYTGDIAVHIRSIFKVLWYPFFVENWDQVHAYLVSDVLTPEEVAHRYGMSMDEVRRHQNTVEASTHFKKIMHGWTSPYIEHPVMGPEMDNGILVHQFHADRIIAPPNGASAVLIGNMPHAIRLGPLTNALGVLPLFPIVEHPSAGYAWGTCSIDDTICAQVDLNDAKTQQGRFRRKKVRAKIIKDKNDEGDTNSLRDDDAVYECNKERAPTVLQFTDQGIEHEQSIAFDLKYVHDAMAVPDVSLGRSDETNARSGRAVIALQDEANERLRVLGKSLNRLMSDVGRFVLAELQAKAVGERVSPIVGQNNTVEWRAWSRASLRPSIYEQNPANVANVDVQTFTNIPTTIGEMRQLVLTLMEVGVFRAGEHDRIIAQVFGLNDFRSIIDKGRAARDKQESEISQWREGKSVPMPMESDDHVEEIPVLKTWVNTEEFRMIAAQNQMLGMQIIEHLNAHEQGKFDQLAREKMRSEFAQMRAAAEFSQKAAHSGLPGAAIYFAIQANGGINPDALPDGRGEGRDKQSKNGKERPTGSNDKPVPGQKPREQDDARAAAMEAQS